MIENPMNSCGFEVAAYFLPAVSCGGCAEGQHKCRDPEPGEQCYIYVTWAMTFGIDQHPDWYPGLHKKSTFQDFQPAPYLTVGRTYVATSKTI